MKRTLIILLMLCMLFALSACREATVTTGTRGSRPTAASSVTTSPTDEPAVTTPTAPNVSIPNVTVPSVTLPDVTVPSVSVPDYSLPDVTVPSIDHSTNFSDSNSSSTPGSYFDAAAATPVIGTWYYTYESSEAEQSTLGISQTISITAFAEFTDNGRLHVYVDQEEAIVALDVLMASPVMQAYLQEYMVEYLYATYAEMDMTKEETDALILSVFGMTVEEYALVMMESTDYASIVAEVDQWMDYYVFGSILYIGDATANDWSLCTFSATHDSLTILSVVLSDTIQAALEDMAGQYEGQMPMDPENMLSSMLPLILQRLAGE